MAKLSWGKCKLEKTTSENGAIPTTATWTELDTPKEDTTQLTTTAGNEKTATEEGGQVVDTLFTANTYQFEFDLFVKKGGTRPFTAVDGVISGEFALRVTPQDTTCEGILIERCIIREEESFTTAEGKILHYVAKCLKPATGNTIKTYTASSTQGG